MIEQGLTFEFVWPASLLAAIAEEDHGDEGEESGRMRVAVHDDLDGEGEDTVNQDVDDPVDQPQQVCLPEDPLNSSCKQS